ncbi:MULTISPECIES: GGDEF domain-containing protein [Luteimonas]|uniref:GGDEF domain-containing protein n=1 Tax=Luteimonas TaxID=83614 RepID=UPI0013044BD5|nr:MULTISPECIES: GGDEF domain-containing protein [Luteimonas]
MQTLGGRMFWLIATLALGSAASMPVAIAAVVPPVDATATGTATDGIDRCFALRQTDPAAALRVADEVLARGALAHDDEMKLQSCLGRAAALLGDSARAVASVDRIDALLLAHPMPPDFALRALSNAGATLHMIGQVPRALEFYARAYEAAQTDASQEAQVAMLINVGSIHSEELEAFEAAERFYAQAQALAAAHDIRNPVLAYNRGTNHARMGNDLAALAAFDTAAQLATGADVALVHDRIRAERVAARARLAPDPSARDMLVAMARDQRDAGDPSGAATTLVRASALALREGDAADALRRADEALAVVGTGAFRIEYRDAARARIAALRAGGAFEDALDAQQALLARELGALRAQNLESLAGLQAQLQDKSSQQEVMSMREARRLEADNLSKTQRLRNAAVLGFVLLALAMVAFAFYQRRVNRRLHQLGSVDALTGLDNRGAATRRLRAMPVPTAPALRNAVFLIDVDHFKHSNDRHGHGTGDEILTQIAARLGECCRPGDIVARWGGEEFLVACPGLDLEIATQIAERLRKRIGDTPFAIPEVGAVPLTISLGFACWPFLRDGADGSGGWQEAVALADRALYASKRGGRDAWTALWSGTTADATIAGILRDPEPAVASGGARALSSRMPIRWRSGDSAPDGSA